MKKLIATGAVLLLASGGAQVLHAEAAQETQQEVQDWTRSADISASQTLRARRNQIPTNQEYRIK
ncbi:hypothetical protein KKHLCK_15510 [Candidatus Electrothrix laxa]